MPGTWSLRSRRTASARSGSPPRRTRFASAAVYRTLCARLSLLELLRELLRETRGQRIGDYVHGVLHRRPRSRFLSVLLGVELLYLLNVVRAVSSQQSAQRLLGPVRIRAAQNGRDIQSVRR